MIDSSMVAQAVPDRDQELSGLTDKAQAAIEHARSLGVDSSEVSASIQWEKMRKQKQLLNVLY